MQDALPGHVARGDVPGLVALVSRRGETHVEAIGMQAFDGGAPMRRDTIFRIASMTKPITAAAAMILVEECELRLDDPVDALPARAGRPPGAEARSTAPLDDTVPAQRPITLRDLLTFRSGHRRGDGLPPKLSDPEGDGRGRASRPARTRPTFAPDEWMKRLGTLPLIHQPGERWLYHTGSDVLGVLIARATGQSLEAFLQERIFEPLGMKDTGFHVPADKLDRLRERLLGPIPRRERSCSTTTRATAAGAGRPPSRPAAGGWSRRSTTISPSAA